MVGFYSAAQDLEKIGKKDMVTVNGGLNINSVYLNTNNPSSKRDPFSWYASGNLTIGMLGWSFPFTYQISNQSRTYSQPFNQTGVTPTYKWIKLHAGWCNINFSQYTLSGFPFLGGGVELTPKKWKIQMLYGQLKKAVEYDFVNESDALMSYKRIGMGSRSGYENNGRAVFFTVFKAKDYSNSLTFIPNNSFIQPQEGTVVSIQAKTPIFKFLTIDGEYALSGVTRNIISDVKTSDQFKNKIPSWFLTQHVTTEFFSAYKASVSFNKKMYSISVNYERIDPGYLTLGAYYFNNDFENITIAPQLRLLKNKLNVSLNTGFQKNNLNNEKLSTTKRLIGSVNVNFSPTKQWLINGSYSNFTSFTKNRPNTDPFYVPTPADTMRFYQVSQSANSLISYNFAKGAFRNNISLNSSNVVSSNTTGNIIHPPTTVYNANLAYSVSHTPSKFSVSLTANANKTLGQNINTIFLGPGVNISKPFLNNTISISLGSIYNVAYLNNRNNGMIFSERLNISYRPKIKHPEYGKPSFSLGCNYVNKPKLISTEFTLSEFTGNVTAGYSF